MTRESPSDQNQSGKETNNSGNQQVPVQAGNPRFRPGLDPDPNPKVVVRAINPPITPDQVVSQAESPSATTLPDVKLEKIRIPRVQNKSIQGYLKAIEAKMTATEKLMKDVVKLQNLQIVTEKELHERKRELYQNTFEEYLLDKTVGFDDRDDPDCTCINIPKKPGGGFPFAGGRRRRRGPGGGSPPPVTFPPAENEADTENEAGSDAGETLGTRDFGDNYAQKEREAINKVEEFRRQQEQKTKVRPPGDLPLREEEVEAEPKTPAVPEPAPIQTPKPLFDPKLDPALAEVEEFRTWVPQDQVPSPLLAFIPDALKAYEANGQRTTSVDTPHGTLYVGFKNTFDRTPVFKYLTNTGNAERRAETEKTLDSPLVKTVLTGTQGLNYIGDLMIGTTGRAGALPRGPYGINSFGRNLKPLNFNIPNLNLRSNLATQYSRARTGLVDARFRLSDASANLRNRFTRDPNRRVQSPEDVIREAEDGLNPYSARARQDVINEQDLSSPLIREGIPSKEKLFDLIKEAKERGQTQAAREYQYIIDEFYLKPNAIKEQASGGIGEMNLYDSGAKQYFRNISSNMNIPKFGGGGFNLLNPMSWFSGDLKRAQDGELENVSNDTFAGKLYNRRKQQEEMMKKLRGYQSGGLVGWWNKGRNVRVPNENNARWRGPDGLLADDAKQITRTDKAFKSGAGGVKGWRPLKAFTPEMIRTGPTPAVRQAFERPARTAMHPLMMALEFIVNDLLINPRSTAVYDQVTGPNAYYNDPAYKGPMPSQNLENAQNSMMSGSNDQKPEVVPLPPDYIKIPGRKKDKSEVGYDAPGIDIEASPFARRDTAYDPGFGVF